MSKKSKHIIAIVLMAIPSLMLVMSSVMKLTGAKQMVESLSKAGLGNYNLFLLGLTELLSVVLLWIPKTRNIGFFLVCSYLGGALSIELAFGRTPTAAILLAIIWISVFLRDRSMFLTPAKDQ
jgi:Flp pilus assembly protein protease CpaA